MTLIELEPRWSTANHGRTGQGVAFLCPKCKTHYLGVWFANPIDGKEQFSPVGQTNCHRWTRIGETFETLTLTPSIQIVGSCGWHGFITNGDVITV